MTLRHIPEEINLKHLSPSIFVCDLQVRMRTLSCWRTYFRTAQKNLELRILQSARVDRNCSELRSVSNGKQLG